MALRNRAIEIIYSAKDKATKVLRSASRSTDKLAGASRKAGKDMDNASGQADKLSKSLTKVKRQIIGLATLAGLKALAKNVAAGADAWKNYAARLKLATDNAKEQAEAERELFDISQETRSSLGANVELYARLAASREELNLQQRELLDLTELVSKAFKVSGATQQEASNATIQLSQGLASGVLRGEEFNSVSEQGIRILQALADSLGKSRGELREMAKQGELTAEVVTAALLSQKDIIAKEYAELPETVEGSIQNLANSWQRYIGEADEATGASARVAETISSLAINFDEVADTAFKAGEIIVAAMAVKGATAVRVYTAEMVKASGATGSLRQQAVLADKALTGIGSTLTAIGWTAVAYEILQIGEGLYGIYDQTQRQKEANAQLAESQERVAERLAKISEKTGIAVNDMESFNQAVSDGRIVFNETNGEWEKASGNLKAIADAAKEAKEATNAFQTPTEVQGGFFAQLVAEMQGLTEKTLPAYLAKIAQLRDANLIGKEHGQALEAMLISLQQQWQATAEAAKAGVQHIEDYNQALLEHAPILGMTTDEYIAHRQARRAATESAQEATQATDENTEANEDLHGSMAGAASVAETMRNHVESLASSLRDLSPAAEETFRSMISDGESAISSVEALEQALEGTEAEIARLKVSLNSATEFGTFFAETALAAEKVRKEFQKEAIAAERLIVQLEGMETASKGVIDSAAGTAAGFELLDDTRLSNLTREIDRLQQATDRLNDDLQTTIDRLQDSIDRQRGNDRAIAEREYQRERERLEKLYQQARKTGDQDALARAQQALALLRQEHALTMREYGEQLKALEDINQEKRRGEEQDRLLPTSRGPNQVHPSGDTAFSQGSKTFRLDEDSIRSIASLVPPTHIVMNDQVVGELTGEDLERRGKFNTETDLGVAALSVGNPL